MSVHADGLAAELKRRLTVRLYNIICLLVVRCLYNNHLYVSHVRDGYTEVRRSRLEVGYTAVMAVGICKRDGEPCGRERDRSNLGDSVPLPCADSKTRMPFSLLSWLYGDFIHLSETLG